MIYSGKKKLYRGKKKLYKKKRYIRKSYRSIPSAPATRSKLVKLKYQQTDIMISNSGAVANKIFRINDLYDPDFSGVGHQSLYRDQLFAIYSRARCLGAKIKIFATSATPSMFKLVLSRCQSGSADTNIDTGGERYGAITRLYNPNSNGIGIQTYTSSDSYFGLAKGTTRKDISAFTQTAGVSLNNSNAMFYQILLKDLAASSTIANMVVHVEITQYVIFEQPLQVASS